MKVDVISCMLDLLQSNKTVALPGLGQWQTDHIQAQIKADRIYPPYKYILFNEKTGSSESLAQCIKEKYKISKKGAEQVIQRFSKLIINRLVNYKEVYIPKLGTLKSGSGKSLNFEEAQPNLVNMAKSYLPSFGLIPVEPKEIKENITAIEKPAIAGTVAATEVTSATGTKALSSSNMNKTNSSTSSSAYYEDEKGCIAQFFWPLFWLLLLAMICFFGFRKCASLSQSVSGENAGLVDGDKNQIADDTKNNTEANLGGDNNNTEETGSYNDKKEYLLTEIDQIPDAIFKQGCVIIVGSYRKSKNVFRMKSLLRSQGKDVYTEVISNGFTRVGFNLDCDRAGVKKLISEARNNIESKAWYLKPKIKVAYK